MPPPLFLRDRRLLAFALANAGGVIGYLPLLTLLLPMKIATIAPDARIGILTLTALFGAIAASASNILFGDWSDRMVADGGSRRPMILGGLVATASSYAAIGASTRPEQLIVSVVLFQIALNAVLAPLMAAMADEIPDDRKGIAGGLLALANPLASAVTAIVVGTGTFAEPSRLAVVAAAMAVCILPLLLLPAARLPDTRGRAVRSGEARGDLWIMWLARLLVQIANVILFHYLLYYLGSVAPDIAPAALAARTSRLLVVAYILPVPVALVLGRLSDRSGMRTPFLLLSAVLAAGSLGGMAAASTWDQAAIMFCGYAVGSATFLAIQATFAMQLLPSGRHRGRDLGLLNLTNTLPACIGPALTWAIAGPKDFGALMLTLAVLTALGGATTLAVRGRL